MDALLLAETLATRLCHDLSGELNALTGAMEVLREDSSPDPEALELASDAGEALVRRLRLARAAWGQVAVPLAVDEWRRLAAGLPHRGVHMHLDGVDAEASFAPAAARLSLNVLLLAAEALPSGGVVTVTGHPLQDMVVRIQGPKAAWPSGLAGMLADPCAAVESLRQCDTPTGASRSLQAALTALIAHAAGLRVSMLLGPNAEMAPPLLVSLTPLH